MSDLPSRTSVGKAFVKRQQLVSGSFCVGRKLIIIFSVIINNILIMCLHRLQDARVKDTFQMLQVCMRLFE